jgi:hypothetical protein
MLHASHGVSSPSHPHLSHISFSDQKDNPHNHGKDVAHSDDSKHVVPKI